MVASNFQVLKLMPCPSAQTKCFYPDKKFCPWLKSLYLLGKRIENDHLAAEKICLWFKSHFPSISQANIRGGRRPKILVWLAIVNLLNIGMADFGRYI